VNKTGSGKTGSAGAETGDTREGFIFALCAYLFWGFLPFYMKAVSHLPTAEIVAHRIVWSVPLAGILLVLLGRTGDIRRALRSPAMIAQSALTAAIISVNWAIYVWSFAAGRAVETALGYYLSPLFSILLASIVLGEIPSRMQLVAVAFAVAGVGLLTWHAGGLPWVSIGLAVSWGFYALFKKTLPIGPAQGFFVEVLLLAIPSLAYILWLESAGLGHFLDNMGDTTLLLIAGVVTATPLILYANGAKKMRLSTIGIMQYIAPTMIFVIAVFIFREPFDLVRLAAFALIWTALVIYTWSLMRMRRPVKTAPAVAGS
jgi:chloramphenicol-sensitive protein RarD